MEPVSWIDELTYQRYRNELRDMAIRYFCCLFMVDQKGEQRNKICTHLKNNLVPLFFPNYSSKNDSAYCINYCKSGLIRYRPWVGEFSTAWGDNDATDDNIINTW